MKFDKKIEQLTPEQVREFDADLSKDNEYITESAGFIPLEVKLKQFEQNGLIAQFNQSDFTSHDLREMYLNPDFDITPEDDLEDVEEKIKARNEFIEQYKKAKSNGQDVKAGTDEPEKKAADAAETAKAES